MSIYLCDDCSKRVVCKFINDFEVMQDELDERKSVWITERGQIFPIEEKIDCKQYSKYTGNLRGINPLPWQQKDVDCVSKVYARKDDSNPYIVFNKESDLTDG